MSLHMRWVKTMRGTYQVSLKCELLSLLTVKGKQTFAYFMRKVKDLLGRITASQIKNLRGV